MELETRFFKSRLVADRVWSIDGPSNDLMYLALGSQKAMLVDTGFGIGDLAGFVHQLTDLPLLVVNTHGHPDHAGGNSGFGEIWISLKDDEIRKRMAVHEYRAKDVQMPDPDGNPRPNASIFLEALIPDREYRVCPLCEGQVIDLGGRTFEIVETPGHTPGSICLLNSKEKYMFCGDTIVGTPAWLYLKHSLPLHVYRESLCKIQKRSREFEKLFAGHNPVPLQKKHLENLILCCEEIFKEPGRGTLTKTFAGEGYLWQHESAQIIYNPGNL
jgi:hydroxyacylglutathione hydrolase